MGLRLEASAVAVESMTLVIVKEDATFKCGACGNLLGAKKGQLLPPCPRCGDKLEKIEGPPPASGDACCGP